MRVSARRSRKSSDRWATISPQRRAATASRAPTSRRSWPILPAKAPTASAKAPGVRRASHSRPTIAKPIVWRTRRGGARRRGRLDIQIVSALNRGAQIAKMLASASGSTRRATAPDAPMGETVTHKNILHMMTPLKHMSPFDVNMALDAGYDAVVPYTSVGLDEVAGLVQDAIFSRPPDRGPRTGFFIGGKDAILALDMLDAAKRAQVPPFEASLFADPAGSFTTAAAMMACVERVLEDEAQPRPERSQACRVRRHRRRRVFDGGDRRAGRRACDARRSRRARAGGQERRADQGAVRRRGRPSPMAPARSRRPPWSKEAQAVICAGRAGVRILTTGANRRGRGPARRRRRQRRAAGRN